MPCTAKFSMTLLNEIISIETSGFLKQVNFHLVQCYIQIFECSSYWRKYAKSNMYVTSVDKGKGLIVSIMLGSFPCRASY